MTVLTQNVRLGPVVAIGGQTDFAYAGKVFDATDFSIWIIPFGTTTPVLKSFPGDYNVTQVGQESGNIEFVTGLVAGDLVIGLAIVPDTQQIPLPPTGGLPGPVVEAMLGRIVRRLNLVEDKFKGGLFLDDPSDRLPVPSLADPVVGEFLRYKSDKTVESVDITTISGVTAGVDETGTDTAKTKLTSDNLARKSIATSETIIIYKDGLTYRAEFPGNLGGASISNSDFVDLWDAVKGGNISSKRIIIQGGDVYTLTKTFVIPVSNYGFFDSRGTFFRYTPTTGDAVVWKGGQGTHFLFGAIDMSNGSTGSALRLLPEASQVTLSNRIEFQSMAGGGAHVGKGLFVDTSLEGMGVNQFVGTDIHGFDEGVRMGTNGDVGGGTNKFSFNWIQDCNICIVEADSHNTGEWNVNVDALIDNSIAIKTAGAAGKWDVIIGAQAPDPTTAKTLVIDSGATFNEFNFQPALNRFNRALGATWEDNSGNRTNVIRGGNTLRGNDNVVINGSMQVNQIGTVTGIGAADVYGAGDMWKYRQSGAPPGRLTSSIISISNGEWLEYDVTTAEASLAAGSLYTIEQAIEADNFYPFRFGTVHGRVLVISFEHQHQQVGTYCVALANSAEDRVYTMEYTQDVVGAAEYEEFTVPADTAGTWITVGTGIGLRVIFVMAAGANHDDYVPLSDTWVSTFKATSNQFNTLASAANFFRIRKVQVEIGQTATEFQHEERSQTLQKCQRYLWKSFNHDTAPAQNAGLTGALARRVSSAGVAVQGLDLNLPVPMKNVPTVTFYNPSAANALWRNVTDAGDSGAAALLNFGERGGGIDHTQIAGDGVGEECAIHVLLDARL